jgi:hypothetical protein
LHNTTYFHSPTSWAECGDTRVGRHFDGGPFKVQKRGYGEVWREAREERCDPAILAALKAVFIEEEQPDQDDGLPEPPRDHVRAQQRLDGLHEWEFQKQRKLFDLGGSAEKPKPPTPKRGDQPEKFS